MYDELPPPDKALTDYHASIYRECLAGFPAEQERIAEDVRVLAYYHLDGGQFVRRNAGDYEHIPIESTGLTKRCVDILTSLSYSPPPTRSILDDEAGDKFLAEVYQDNHVNSLLARADALATLLGYAAIEAVPAVGLKPVRLYLWNASELILRPDEEDATSIGHVITRDTDPSGKIRYTWWSRGARRVFVAKQDGRISMAGGRSTQEVSATVNPFGARLPFGFVHYQPPVSSMTVPGLGEWLADQEAAIDVKRYQLGLGVSKYLLPKGMVSGVTNEWQPEDVVGEFWRIPSGVVAQGQQPRIEYLQAQLNVDQAESHIESAIERTLTAIGVPLSIYRMDQSSTASGDAIEAEQKPLVDYTRSHQETLKCCENDLAEAVLAVGGAWLNRPELAAAGLGGANLSVSWPDDLVSIPGVDQDTQDRNALNMGIASLVDVVRRRYRLPSDEAALQRILKVRQDNIKLAELYARLDAASPPAPAPEGVADGVFSDSEIAPSGEQS